MPAGFFRSGVTCLALWGVSGCVSDHDVENDVRASPGLAQPAASGGKLTLAVACDRLKTARSAASSKLGCDVPATDCPKDLYVAGSIPCDEFSEGSVEACEGIIEKYEDCSDFSTKVCTVTPIAASCRTPVTPEAAPPAPEAASPPKDSGGDGSKAEKDGGTDGKGADR